MGLDDIAKGALLLIGAGIIAERFGAGPGLTGLGTGIRTIAAAPLGGVGTGLGEFAGGLRTLGESFGDIGRGIGSIFEAIPRGPITGIPFSPITATPLPEPAPSIPGPTYVSSGNAGNPSNVVMNSGLPANLGRIYEISPGVIGFRKAPSLTFGTRREARKFLKNYNSFDGNYVMQGTSV